MVKYAVILCGGLATRMGNLCKNTPKALLPIYYDTVLHRQLTMLGNAGVENVILATGHLHNEIENKIGSFYGPVDIFYSQEDEPLGTGGAFRKALDSFVPKDQPSFGLNGDILMPEFKPENIDITIAWEDEIIITASKWKSPYGRLELIDDGWSGPFAKFEEKKPQIINAGFYVFMPKARNKLPLISSIEKDVFEKRGWPFHVYDGPWFDVGTPESYEQAKKFYEVIR